MRMNRKIMRKSVVTPGSANENLDFENLFQQHWERMCRVAGRLVGDMDEAQDVALAAFLQLYQHPPAEEQNLGGWLYRVVTRLGYNALRTRRRQQLYESQAANGLNASAAEDAEASLERRQQAQQVRSVLQKMKPRTARLLALRSAGFSYAEIAAALEVPPSSVGTLLARAEREFEAKFLKERGEG